MLIYHYNPINQYGENDDENNINSISLSKSFISTCVLEYVFNARSTHVKLVNESLGCTNLK